MEAGKGPAVVVWGEEDYLREANSQLSEKDVYRDVKSDVECPLVKVIKIVLRKIRNRRDITDETLDYFLVNNPKLRRFYLLPKIQADQQYPIQAISFLLDFYLNPLGKKVKSNIQDTNDFFKKITNLPPLSDGLSLCTIYVVGLYPNIPHEEGLIAIRTALDTRNDKQFRQLRGTATGVKMVPPYAVIFIDSLEEE